MDAGEAGTPGTVTTRRKAAVCALLFGATLLNYLDRQALAVMAPLVRAEMGLDLAQVGWLFSAFYWCYAAGQIGVGFALDRVKVKVAYAVAVALWSAAGAATGLAAGLTSLLLLRALLGLCEAANWPAALRVVAEVFPRRERALANGVFQSGSSVGWCSWRARSAGARASRSWGRWARSGSSPGPSASGPWRARGRGLLRRTGRRRPPWPRSCGRARSSGSSSPRSS
jgi:MFS family permease